ncbi:MAG: hypothetical protein IKL68_00050 [Clostridia bacterium]|nr:hypothetical protein [Clostridia bacterium]
MNKMKRGITVSTLSVAIAIMLILVSVSSVAGIRAIKTAAYEEFTSKIVRLSDDVNIYVKKNGKLPVKNEIVSRAGMNSDLKSLLTNNGDENNMLYVIDLSKLTTEGINMGEGTTEDLDVFLVAENTYNVYYLKGFEYRGEKYYGFKGTDISDL